MASSGPVRTDLLSLQPVGRRNAFWIPAVLAACAVATCLAYLALGRIERLHPGLAGPDVLRFFDLNEEANLPTWFSALLWQVAALLAFSAAQRHRAHGWPHAAYWIGMIPLFLFLSLDEGGKIHESVGSAIGLRSGSGGWLDYTYAWVLFGAILVTVVGLAYARLLFLLRRRLAVLFVLSATLFLLGAVAVESIGASVEAGSIPRIPLGQSWRRMIALEETLEMLGAILLIRVLLEILALDGPPYRRREARGRRTPG